MPTLYEVTALDKFVKMLSDFAVSICEFNIGFSYCDVISYLGSNAIKKSFVKDLKRGCNNARKMLNAKISLYMYYQSHAYWNTLSGRV